MALALPPPTQPLTDKDTGTVTEPWYRILSEISRIRFELDALKRLTRNDGAMDAPFTSAVVLFVGST
jgi:hypothetical protein